MPPWVYAVMSICVLLVSALLFGRAAGTLSLRFPNIVSWNFYIHFVLASFIGVALSVFGVSHYMMDKVAPIYRERAFWVVCYVMIATPLAMILTQRALFGGNVRRKLLTYYAEPLHKVGNQALFWFVLSLIAFVAVVYVYVVLRRIPFLYLLQGDSLSAAQARIVAARGFGGIVYVRNILALFLAPLVSYVAYAYYRYYGTPFYRWWSLFSIVVAAAALTYSGEKAPIIYYFLTLFFVRSYINGGVKLRELAAAGLGVAALLLVTYTVFMKQPLNTDTLLGIVRRITMSEISGLSQNLETFPQIYPFTGGTSFPDWMVGWFGIEHLTTARLLMMEYNPTGIEEGTAGVINTLFVGEAWANFGLPGLLLAPLWVGFVIQAIYSTLLSFPKTPLAVALMAYFTADLPITGGIVAFVWNPIWLILGVVAIVAALIDVRDGTIYLRFKLPRRTRRWDRPQTQRG